MFRQVFLTIIFLMASLVQAADLAVKRPLRIFHVMSFHSPYRWTDGQFAGFKQGLGNDVQAEYKVLQMDSNQNKTQQAKALKGAEARAIIESWKPDLVYVSDDDAVEYVVKPLVNTKTPFVFSGVNKKPEDHGLIGAVNVTGVLEREHSAETIRLLQSLDPKIKRIAVISDDSPQFVPIIGRVKENVGKLPGVKIVTIDTVKTFTEYQKLILSYPEQADAILMLGIFTLRDAKGNSVPYQDVLKWVAENSRLPDSSFWIDRIFYGTLAAMTVSEQEQGQAAGKLARAIVVEGKSPDSLPMLATAKGHPAINLARAKALDLNLKSSQLLTAEVIPNYQWVK